MEKSDLYDALTARILTLEFAPGAALDEAALCAAYGVSRTPLRETFQRLAGEGFLTLAPKRGAAVSSMDLDTMRSFFQAAPMIYAAIARLAAENAAPAQLEKLRAIQEEFRAARQAKAPRAMAMSNHRFHQQIGAMAASPYLGPSLGRLLIDHTRMSQTFYDARARDDERRIDAALEQHDLMIDAFAAREPARAVELTLDHWALSRDRIERFVRPDPLPLDLATPEKRHAL